MMSGTSSRYEQLQAQRKELESELTELLDGLKSVECGVEKESIANETIFPQHNTNMTEPLVDGQGFPRADIDVYSVRHLRSNIIRKQNDHKALMGEIEAEMHAVFAQLKATSNSSSSNSNCSNNALASASASLKAFAVVNSVAPGCPAATAGLAAGDAVVSFGGVDELAKVASVVREGSPIDVVVRRGDKLLTLSLVPQKWGGRGLLGCHLVVPTTSL